MAALDRKRPGRQGIFVQGRIRLKKTQGCPPELIDFAEQRCREYQPADLFVMDSCCCGEDLFIIESGCIHSAGIYAADVFDIGKACSDYYRSYAE